MVNFLNPFDWNSFGMNVLVSTIFLIIASFLLPDLFVRKLKRKNKKYIIKKTSSVIQEICEFINDMPFKSDELNERWMIINTSKKSVNFCFIGISTINVLNPIVFPQIWIIFNEYMRNLDADTSYKILKEEKIRLEYFRLKLESIITIYSLHVDENVISAISDLCLDIKAFEISFKMNFTIDDLIESGKTNRTGVFGLMEIADIYKKTLMTLKNIIDNKNFEIEIKSNGYS